MLQGGRPVEAGAACHQCLSDRLVPGRARAGRGRTHRLAPDARCDRAV